MNMTRLLLNSTIIATILCLFFSTNTRTTFHSVEAFSAPTKYIQRSSPNRKKSLVTIPLTKRHCRLGTMAQLASKASDDENEDATPQIRNIVIAGGGIVGTSVAYYLVQDHLKDLEGPFSLTLVDPTGKVGSCASGKAGGFLARDWRNGTPLQELQQKGFLMHEQLAQDLGSGIVDYRRLTCAAVAIDETEEEEDDEDDPYSAKRRVPNKPPSKKLIDLEWVDPDVVLWDETFSGTPGVYPMGDEETIAQVHPRKLCEAMWESISKEASFASISKVELVSSKIVNAQTENGSVTSVELENGKILESDVLVVACGPWSYEANQWFGDPVLPQITGVKCHSILVPSARGKPNTQAVFFDSNGAIGAEGDLEVYPRPDGDSYVNGFANEEGVCTEAPGKEAVEDDKIALLREAMDFVEQVQGATTDTDIQETPRDHTQQVCYWPETPSGFPIIGKIPNIQGAYVAVGHSVWGILQGPPTGKGLAELIVKGKYESVDLYPFGLE